MNNYLVKYAFLLCVFSIFFVGCSSDNSDEYQPINTVINPDSVSLNQDTSLIIDIFGNDFNVPANAILTLSEPSNGAVSIQNNNTANNLLDDTLLYTPNTSFTGQDSFNYTICSANNHQDCVVGLVNIIVLPISLVNYQIDQDPFTSLSEYNFFESALSNLIPNYGVLPYEPINSLFSDYAHKKRFIWMPQGVSATYAGDGSVLDFPLGTILIKSFYYENVLPNNNTQLLETRLMMRESDGWAFANYIWNDSQTEALLDTSGNGAYENIEWLENGLVKNTNYRIPSTSECFTCHKAGPESIPIGPKPQNLNKNFVYSDGNSNQLQKLVDFGYLEDNLPSTIYTVVEWDDASQPLNLRMRSYVDINCAHCHSDDKHCDYRPVRFAFNENIDETNLGVCVPPDTTIEPYTHIVVPQNKNRSLLYFRLTSTLEQYRMPLLGRTLVHEEAIEMIELWIDSLTNTCE